MANMPSYADPATETAYDDRHFPHSLAPLHAAFTERHAVYRHHHRRGAPLAQHQAGKGAKALRGKGIDVGVSLPGGIAQRR